MTIIHKDNITPIEDPCGELRELYHSANMSIAHDTVIADAREHMHRVMEEIYYVTEGEGQISIADETYDVKKGDLVPIPKNTWHYLKKLPDKQFEVLVITHPKYMAEDMIFRE